MPGFNLSDEISAGGKRLQVQTTYSDENRKAVSTVFRDGEVVDEKEIGLEETLSHAEVQKRVQDLHQEMMSETKLLFYIAEKIKEVKHVLSCNKLGLVFLRKNLLDEAIEQFSLAIQWDPKFVDAYNNLGVAFIRKGEYDRAIEFLKKGLEMGGNYADLRNNLGIAYQKKGLYSEAIAEFQEALKINPSYFEAHFNLGVVYLASVSRSTPDPQLPPRSARERRALMHLERAAELNPQLGNPAFERALELMEEKKFPEAMEALSEAKEEVAKEIDDYFMHDFYLKFMFGGKGKDEQFIAAYTQRLKEEIEKHPDYADLRNNLGVAYLVQCRNLFLKALEEFRAALKLNPSFKRARRNLKLAENEGKGFLILLRALFK